MARIEPSNCVVIFLTETTCCGFGLLGQSPLRWPPFAEEVLPSAAWHTCRRARRFWIQKSLAIRNYKTKDQSTQNHRLAYPSVAYIKSVTTKSSTSDGVTQHEHSTHKVKLGLLGFQGFFRACWSHMQDMCQKDLTLSTRTPESHRTHTHTPNKKTRRGIYIYIHV